MTTATRLAHAVTSAGVNSMCSSCSPRRTQVGSYVEVTVPGRAVVLFGEPDVPHAVEDPLDAHPALHPGQGPPGAGVDAAPERDVDLGVRPVDPELVGALEQPGVTVGRAVEQHHRRPRGDVDAGHVGVPTGQAEVGLDRALDAQRLLDEARDPVACGPAARPGARGTRRGISGRRPAAVRSSPGRRRRGRSPSARRW